jgi:ketosteroid isomerase-like protein
MDHAEMDALAEGYFEAVCAGDGERLRGIFADDVRWLVPQGAIEPYAGLHEGADHVIGMRLGAVGGSCLPGTQRFQVRTTLIGDDVVCKETQMTGEAPDGRRYRNDYTFFFVIRDGRIAEIREHVDTAYAAGFFS